MSAEDDEDDEPAGDETNPIPVIFHKTSKGNEPVRKWLKEDLPDHVRRAVGGDIWLVQREWPVGKPLVDGFGQGLFEVRTEIDKNIYRVLFCFLAGVDGPPPRSPQEVEEDAEPRRGTRQEAAKGARVMTKKSPRGSTLDSLFEELGEVEEVRRIGEKKRKEYHRLLAQKKRLAARVETAMAKKNMTQTALALAMETSRTVVHRLLDANDTGVTLATVYRAEQALGVELLRVP